MTDFRLRVSRRLLLAFTATTVCAVAGAPAAFGGTVSSDGTTLTYEAAPGEVNDLRVSMAENRTSWTVTETGAPLVAGPGCTIGSDPMTATCLSSGPTAPAAVEAVFGDSADEGDFTNACYEPCTVRLWGGYGPDLLWSHTSGDALVFGGPGADELEGIADMFGQRGNDVLRGGSGWRGEQRLDGGLGSDLMSGGARQGVEGDRDVVYADYGSRKTRVFVSLDGRRNDGERGENDLVLTNGVIGSSRDDVITGDAQQNHFVGGSGDDLMKGGDAKDTIDGDEDSCSLDGAGRGDDHLYGGEQEDRIRGCGGADVLMGGTNGDHLFGGTGGDRLRGGPGGDDMWGDVGNDGFEAHDGRLDEVHGGPGRDTARLDPGLDQAYSIERRSG